MTGSKHTYVATFKYSVTKTSLKGTRWTKLNAGDPCCHLASHKTIGLGAFVFGLLPPASQKLTFKIYLNKIYISTVISGLVTSLCGVLLRAAGVLGGVSLAPPPGHKRI